MNLKSIIFIITACLTPLFRLSAQTLEDIPGQTSVGGDDLLGYLNNIYKFGISITGILAIVMVSVGAFAYIVTSAGNSSKIISAKETIQNALIGLVIALTAYLFLYVINPDLVGGTLDSPKQLVNNLSTSANSATGSSGSSSLADGITCLGISPTAPACSGCPSCSNCTGGNHHLDNSSGNNVCGQAPSSTVTGCCQQSSGVSSQCQDNITQTACSAQPNSMFDETRTCQSSFFGSSCQ